MPRPCKFRMISGAPTCTVYKPAGVPARDLDWITLEIDEFESIRLLDHLGYEQEQAAQAMGISRPTITRIYSRARQKIATALVNGNAIRIVGLSEISPQFQFRGGGGGGCRHRHGQRRDLGQIKNSDQENQTK